MRDLTIFQALLKNSHTAWSPTVLWGREDNKTHMVLHEKVY